MVYNTILINIFYITTSCVIIYFVYKWDGHQKYAMELATALYKKSGKPTFYGSVQKNVLDQVKL